MPYPQQEIAQNLRDQAKYLGEIAGAIEQMPPEAYNAIANHVKNLAKFPEREAKAGEEFL